VNSLTREQKIYAAAGASILFIISLFFPWFGGDFGGVSVSGNGTDAVPSWWILLIFSAAAAGLLIAEVRGIDLPVAVSAAAGAAYLSSVSFIVTLMIFLEGTGLGGRKIGLFLALIFSAAAVVLSVMHWREEGH